MEKRAGFALLTAAAIMMSSVTSVFADTKLSFSDISEAKYEWAVGYIEEMYEKGFISGYEDGTYKPDKDITRLEAISLFARTIKSEATEAAVEAAVNKYGEKVEKLGLNFGGEDVAYMLYRGILTENELETYLSEEKRSEAMPRHEAAAIITKVLCAENQAAAEVMVVLDYTDAKDIPNNASKYVYYVTDNNIMSGMGDGTFSPNSGVLRSQIAVMLSKTVEFMRFSVEELKVASVDDINIMYYEDGADVTTEEPLAMGYNEDTKFYVEGDIVQAKNVPENVKATFTYVKNEVAFVDIENKESDRVVTGVLKGISRNNGIYTIAVATANGQESIQVAEGAEIKFSGATATLSDFSSEATVTVYVSEGLAIKVIGEEKNLTITNATIEENSIVEDNTITISHAKDQYNGLKLIVAADAKVIKNDVTASMSELYKGDVVKLVLEHNIVREIKAESMRKVVEGTIKIVEISANPKMTVTVKGVDNVYDITSGIEVIVNNKEGSIYDFRVGDIATITLESKAVVKVVVKGSAGVPYSKTGVISSIHDGYGFIKIMYNDNGVSYEETVYCGDKTKYINSSGASKSFKDLRTGDAVSVRGTMANGAFEASLILIEVE